MKQQITNHTLTAVPMPGRTTAEKTPELGRPTRELDKFFKALSDSTRRTILQLLERDELSVGEIVGNFELSQPTISRHLSVLKEAQLVADRRMGQQVMYRLLPHTLTRSAGKFFTRFASWAEISHR